jgi:hypothetical protein
MPIESSVTVISDLNASYPENTDSIPIGANQIRNVKTALLSLNTSSATKGAAQVGFLQSGTGAITTRKVQDKLREFPSVTDFGAVGNGTTDDTSAISTAIAACAGKTLLFPNGIYKITSPITISVADITLVGIGAEIRQVTAMTAALQVNASGVTIADIYFNSTQAKTGTMAASAYYPSAIYSHAGVLQVAGDRLTVRNCRFYNWTASVGINGSFASSSTLAEDLRVVDCLFQKHDFGILARQFDGLIISRCIGKDCEDTTGNPAHLVYITDRSVTQSRGLTITGCEELDNTSSSPYKVRNVAGVTIVGNVGRNCGRGVELGTCTDIVIGSNSISSTRDVASDTQQSLITLDECERYLIQGNLLDMGANALYGVRLRTDTGSSGNKYGTVRDNVVRGTFNTVDGCIAYYAEGQTDVDFIDNHFINDGTGNVNHPYRVDTGCTRVRIINPSCSQASGIANPERLLRVIAGATSTTLFVSPLLWTDWNSSSSVSDAGTSTTVALIPSMTSGKVMLFGDGTVGAPSIAFESDPDNGFYRTGTNTWAVSVGGAQTIRFVSNRTEFAQPLWSSTDNGTTVGASTNRFSNGYITTLRPGDGTAQWTSGAGTPEGAVSAVVGSLYTRTDGGANTTLYVKESGSGNTGWVAK